MVFLLELKEGFKKFYNKYDTYLVPAVRFVMALVSFLMLNASIGYMSKLKNPLIAVAMAVGVWYVGAFLNAVQQCILRFTEGHISNNMTFAGRKSS